MNKIIFLDIDGPVIHVNATPLQSIMRLRHIPQSIDNLNYLCDATGAKIVTNSMHNFHTAFGKTLRQDLIRWGVDEEHFHPRWRTFFPHIDYEYVNSTVRGIGRLVAIEEWMDYEGDAKWVCFDDRKFTYEPNLIHIKKGRGIKEGHVRKALDILT